MTSLFHQLSLRAKLTLGFMAMIGLACVLGGVSLYSQQRVLKALQGLLDVQAKIADISMNSHCVMLKARRNEKDFLLRYPSFGFDEAKSRYASLLTMNLAEIRENMTAVRRLVDDQKVIGWTKAIEQAIARYEHGFVTAVDLIKELSHRQNELEAILFKAIREVDTAMNRPEYDSLVERLLVLRLTGRDKFVGGIERERQRIRESVARFREALAQSSLGPDGQDKVAMVVGEYEASFAAYADIGRIISEVMASYLEAAHEVEPKIEELRVWAADHSAAIRDEVSGVALTNASIVTGTAAATAILGLLVAYWISRKIASGVRECVAYARTLEQGDLEAQLKHPPTAEFGIIAGALEAMAASIRDSREVLKRQTLDLAAANEELKKEIGERTRAEESLRQAKEAADAANLAKSSFLANMSHEIRTPMTAILGYTDLLMNPNQSEAEQNESIQIIRRNGMALLSILNDILDLSKIEAGKLTIEHIRCSAAQIALEVTSLLLPRALEKNLRLITHYLTPVPAVILTDPVRLRQILINLIGNALKFTEVGSVRVEIAMEGGPKTPDPKLRFDVVDTGIGLSPEQQANLFQAFVQGEVSTTRRFGGAGLGLAISQRLAQELGGSISVQSAAGKGSTFSLTIATGPLAGVAMLKSPSAVTQSLTESVAYLPEKEPRLRGRLLLAEDSPDIQRLIKYYLTIAGAEVTTADNGQDAYEKAVQSLASSQPFDLILMDMQMPLLDGYGATRLLRQKGYSGPILALTANAMESERERCLIAGCDDFASKPIERLKLLEAASRHLSPRGKTMLRVERREDGHDSEMQGPSGRALLSCDADEAHELTKLFMDHSQERLSALRMALDSWSLDDVASLAHQVKGSAGNFGFDGVSKVAGDVETCLRSGKELLQDLIGELEGVCGKAEPV